MRGRDGHDTSYVTETLNMGPGESYDVLFEAPTYTGNGTDPDVYVLYNRQYQRANNLAGGGFGGAATHIQVFPPGHLLPQGFPNDWAEVAP